jgi:hypothetical protein
VKNEVSKAQRQNNHPSVPKDQKQIVVSQHATLRCRIEHDELDPNQRAEKEFFTGRRYLILVKQSFSRSISELTCVSMVFCNASVPLFENSAEAFLSRFSFQSRTACLVTLCASAAALWYAVMQASAFEQVLHSS